MRTQQVLYKQQGNYKRILEKAKPRMFHFKNLLHWRCVYIKMLDKAGNCQKKEFNKPCVKLRVNKTVWRNSLKIAVVKI